MSFLDTLESDLEASGFSIGSSDDDDFCLQSELPGGLPLLRTRSES